MANLYPYFGTGFFEAYPNPYAGAPVPPAGSEAVGKTNDMAYQGVYSLGIFYGSAGGHYNQDYKLYFSFRGPLYPIVLTPGNRYLMRCKIKTPAGAGLLGTDGVKLFIGKDYSALENGVVTTVLPDATIYTMDNGDILRVSTVGQVKGAVGWTEISIEFTEPSSGTPGYRKPLGISISTAQTNTSPVLAVPFGEDVFNSGKLYIDMLELLDVAACDLAFDSPAYTKTNETGVGLNDGSFTIRVLSSFTKQYSLDNVTWQSSNVFSPKPPGSYNVYIRDTNPAGCSLYISNIIVAQFVPAPPPPPPVASTLTIDLSPVNQNNFVSWFSTTGDIAFNKMVCTNSCFDLPNAYRINKMKRRHAPIAAINEEFTFYLNFASDYNEPNFSDYRLHLINQNGVVVSNIAVLQKDLFADGVTYNIWAAITLAAITPGIYRLAIARLSTNAIIFCSNDIEVMTLANAKCLSTALQFRASFDMYKYRYIALPNFLHKIRLKMYWIEQHSEGDLAQYRSASNGRLRNVSLELDRMKVFETYWFDDAAHNAMEVFQAHDFILLNAKFYLPKSLYKTQWDVRRNLNKGRIEMYEQDFSTMNRYGTLNNITVIGSEDPLLLGDGGGRIKL